MTNLELQIRRWINILRPHKVEDYEHKVRGKGEHLSSRDLDTICNEMEIFLMGFTAFDELKKEEVKDGKG